MTRSRIAQDVERSAEEEIDYLHSRLLIASLDPEAINENPHADLALERWRALEESLKQGVVSQNHAGLLKTQHLHKVFSEIVLSLAKNDHINALYELGIKALLHRDHDNAIQWLQRAATLGHTPSALQLMKLYCEGQHGIRKQPIVARKYYQDQLARLQNAYFSALYQSLEARCSEIKSEHAYLVEYAKLFSETFQEVESSLRTKARIDYLSSEADVMAAVDALNRTLNTFPDYLVDKKVKWVVANDFHPKTKVPIINEEASTPLRPMIEATFIIKPGQVSVTENDLFNLLTKEWRVPFRGITKTGSEFRCCVLSIDDIGMLLRVPTLCAPYTLQFKNTTTHKQVGDTQDQQLILLKKQYLLTLKQEVNLNKWNNKGVTMYMTHVPDLIHQMREKLTTINEQSSYDDCIIAFEAIRKLFEFHSKKSGRDSEVEAFYGRIVKDVASLLSEPKLTDSLYKSVRK